MSRPVTRRSFLQGSSAAGVGLWVGPSVLRLPRQEKLNVACFGIGGRGGGNANAVAGENLIALCDADEARAKEFREQHADVPFFADYRELLDRHGDQLDAVTVSTPDHMHAPIALAAMKRGLHCYCEKPLTWSVQEAREMARVAREKGVVTQMGNQGTAQDGFRSGVETLRAGVLGDVREVHLWSNRPVWPQGIPTPTDTPEVPKTLHWNEWLGCAPERDYNPAYLPFAWRGWYDFGAGALGDMACHTMNLAYMGLELGAPTRVSAETTETFPDSFPAGSKVTYEFPARGERPAVTLIWYDGAIRPADDILGGDALPGSGCLIVGERGSLYSPDDYGSQQELRARGDEVLERPEPTLPRSPGHHREWLDACRGGDVTPLSSFAHAGPFTEAVQLGNLAVRVGKPIEWDAAAMKARGVPAADPLIRRSYRDGFGI